MIHRSALMIVISLASLGGLVGLTFGGCATGTKRALETALSAPPKAAPAAATANEEGIKLFYARQWEAARVKFEEAIKVQPTLAEAHYNLGLVYDALRNDKEARKHFVEAANLAPGNKVIWASPWLRQHGDTTSLSRSGKDFFDPSVHH